MIEDIRVVEWAEGRFVKNPRWNVEVKRVGSDKWEPIKVVKLDKKNPIKLMTASELLEAAELEQKCAAAIRGLIK